MKRLFVAGGKNKKERISSGGKFKVVNIGLTFLLLTLFTFSSLGSEPLKTQEETGMEYLDIPPKTPSPGLTAYGDTYLGDPYRYSARLQQWKKMVDKKAYFRDLLVGWETHIYNANDGDTWTCEGRYCQMEV